MKLAIALSVFAAAAPAFALGGRVADPAGRPLPGAMVSARNAALARTTTVYADREGQYRFPALTRGDYDVRARSFGYRDSHEMGVTSSRETLDLVLDPETDEYELLSQLPSNRWMNLLLDEIGSDEMREEFVRQCTFCHQQGNWATRVERSPEEWRKILSLMARMGAILTPETREALPGLINAAYDPEKALGKLERQITKHPLPSPAGLQAVIDEWEVGDRASVQHDVVVHPEGSIWSVDTTKDFLYRLDPKSGERTAFKIPGAGLPIGGIFPNGTLPPNAEARVAPHSLQVGPEGKIWVTLCLGNKIGIFDPETAKWELIDQPEGLYPHTIRFDPKGRAWYTLAVSNHVSMIDSRTREHRTIRLPSRTWSQAIGSRLLPLVLSFGDWMSPPETLPKEAMAPVPYGIDVAPDGGIWFSQLNVERIGRIDPDSFEVTMFDTPFPGPRRLRFDSKGKIWIPGFSAGVVSRFDPETGTFQSWTLPTEPEGTETPYALNVDLETDTVWICGTNSDTLIRFRPDTEEWTIFPLPYRVTYTREIDFDENGGVWTSNSNTPGWHIESENPHLIRLQPG